MPPLPLDRSPRWAARHSTPLYSLTSPRRTSSTAPSLPPTLRSTDKFRQESSPNYLAMLAKNSKPFKVTKWSTDLTLPRARCLRKGRGSSSATTLWICLTMTSQSPISQPRLRRKNSYPAIREMFCTFRAIRPFLPNSPASSSRPTST